MIKLLLKLCVLGLIVFSSCSDCVECDRYDLNGNKIGSQEYCGTEADEARNDSTKFCK